jgi:hypothetical protein
MTPKEKALNFTEKFIAPTMDRGLCGYFKSIAIAKECALIAANELIEHLQPASDFGGEINMYTVEYWEKVKQEIEKI